mmetsp:Transcript_31050/g.72191  ORF Transcript_31050/g.72191 Transcript_31050/m.72191 type:complete len:240 (+) Transcript_31050:29-748(+)
MKMEMLEAMMTAVVQAIVRILANVDASSSSPVLTLRFVTTVMAYVDMQHCASRIRLTRARRARREPIPTSRFSHTTLPGGGAKLASSVHASPAKAALGASLSAWRHVCAARCSLKVTKQMPVHGATCLRSSWMAWSRETSCRCCLAESCPSGRAAGRHSPHSVPRQLRGGAPFARTRAASTLSSCCLIRSFSRLRTSPISLALARDTATVITSPHDSKYSRSSLTCRCAQLGSPLTSSV